uniref:ABC transmembrane type-1 domain-containing protein n=1 Tax=Panagrellus redivivus TaxID=6233 RepID=A0A7E4ZS56_PANRE
MEGTFAACPILATIASFIGYVVIDGQKLTAQKAFMVLILFNYMRQSIYALPNLVRYVITLRISLRRVTEFLNEDEVPENGNNLDVSDDSETVFAVKDATYAWSTDSDAFIPLKSLNFTLKRGELVGVIGRVGSGKSSFLSAICGELYRINGQSYKQPNITTAVASQEPWIQNLTLKDNIVFGAPSDEDYYQKTIAACALIEDLTVLPAGDQTEIGERGVNLSGGQKSRIALARAVYQRAELYILDDTLSAVDSHVGAHIFQHVIGPHSILKDTTRVFALNSIGFLDQCDRIIALKDGQIVDVGTFDELVARQGPVFMELVKDLQTGKKPEASDEPIDDSTDQPSSETRQTDQKSAETALQSQDLATDSSENALLIDEEDLAIGNVGFKMYIDYCRAFGRNLVIAYIFGLFAVRTVFESGSEIKLASWMSAAAESSNSTSSASDVESLAIYGTLAITAMIVITLSNGIVAIGSYRASKNLHDNLLMSLLRSPMAFFDRTPMGRILNRLSKDIEAIDTEIPTEISFAISCTSDLVMYIASAVFVLPLLVAIVIPVVAVCVGITRYYTYAAVQLRRLCSKSWSTALCSGRSQWGCACAFWG